jgi:signal transduction histidine kinase
VIDLRRAPVIWRDLPLALALAAASVLPGLRGHGTQLGDLPTRPFDALAVVAITLECLPLAVRRKWPAVSLVLVAAGFVLDQLRGYHLAAGTALPLVLISAGLHLERRRRVIVGVLSAAYVPLAFALHRHGSGEGVAGFATFYLVMAIAWGAGTWLRQARVAEAERRRLVAEGSRAAERARIARELHDVVTHHVTAMVVQAEAARYLTAAPERLDETLTAVAGTGRRAIADLRHLLDLLDPGHEADAPGARSPGHDARSSGHHPGAATAGDLRALVERTRQAGQPVELTEQGSPVAQAGSAEAVAYTVVREALTNALKHDHGGRTSVQVRHGAGEITVEVATDGSGTGAGSPGGSGRGLAGLRERVGVLGGELSAGRQPGGGFLVHARIPGAGPS